jgi:hypothetical protein
MSKHTPGPWNMTQTPNDIDFSHEIHEICAVYRGNNSKADARLIAAAPDLLDTLITLAEATESTTQGVVNPIWIHNIAKAAIAKATSDE